MLGTPKARERRFHHGFSCPRCQNTDVRRWGHERSGLQRYQCRGCGRTFNDLTNTAMAGTHLVTKWSRYANAMRHHLSTRVAAREIDVSHKTVWRWRHKVLPGTANAGSLTAALRGIVTAQGTTLCTDGSSALRIAARSMHVKHVALVTKRNERKRGIYHVQTVNSYQGRLKEWLAPFRGVATKYLNRYLTWHIIHERIGRLTAAQARSVLVGNTAELRGDSCCPNCSAALNAA